MRRPNESESMMNVPWVPGEGAHPKSTFGVSWSGGC